MTTSSPAPGAGQLAVMRMIAGAFIGSALILALPVSFIVPSETWFAMPSVLSLALPIVLGAAALAGVLTVGHRVPAIARATPPERARTEAVGAFQTTFFIRLAFAEVPVLVGIAASVIDENGSAIPYAIGAVISLILLATYAFPSPASVRRVERQLDREGGRSHLSRALGVATGPGGYSGDGIVL